MRMVYEIPGLMKTVRVCNGKKCWEASSAMGMREITGKELAAVKFQTAFDNPANKMRDIFSEIKVPDETVKVGEFACYVFTCVLKRNSGPRTLLCMLTKKNFSQEK
jgi:hypothetical protein